jgi:predicted ester cyclase
MSIERRYNAGVSPEAEQFTDEDGEFDIAQFILQTTHEVWDEQRFERIRDYFADGFVSYGAEGREFADLDRLYDYVLRRTSAFPDTRVFVDDLLWVGDDETGYRTSHRFTVTGTNTGRSPYGAPTGKRLRLTGIANCTVEKVDRRWQYTEERAEDDQFAVLRACTPGEVGPYPDVPDQTLQTTHAGTDSDDADADADADVESTTEPPARSSGDGSVVRTGPDVRPGAFDPVSHLSEGAITVWNDRSVGALEDYYAADVSIEAPSGRDLRGVDELRAEVLERLAAFPDLTFRIDELLVVDDGPGYDSSMAFTATGTHAGPSKYGSATGKKVRFTGIVNQRLRQVGDAWRVVELREDLDERRLMRLLH